MVRFSVTITEAGAIVRVLGFEHTGHDTRNMAQHVAPWCREFIRVEHSEREGTTVTELVKAVKAEALRRGLEALKESEPSLSRDELKRRWLLDPNAGGPFMREFLITRKQVRDQIRAYVRNHDLMPDEADSIRAWTTQHPDDTLLYRPGVDTPEGQEEDVRGTALWFKALWFKALAGLGARLAAPCTPSPR